MRQPIPNPPKDFQSWCDFYSFIEKSDLSKDSDTRIHTTNNREIELNTTVGKIREYAFLEMWCARLMPNDIHFMRFAVHNAESEITMRCDIFLTHMLKLRFHL